LVPADLNLGTTVTAGDDLRLIFYAQNADGRDIRAKTRFALCPAMTKSGTRHLELQSPVYPAFTGSTLPSSSRK
jgi:hypothetical protein